MAGLAGGASSAQGRDLGLTAQERSHGIDLDNLSLTQLQETRAAMQNLTLSRLIEAGPAGCIGHLPAAQLIEAIRNANLDRFTPEFLPFLIAERDFRADPSPERARMIAEKFLSTGVDLEVNISAHLRRVLIDNIQAGPHAGTTQFPAGLFKEAVNEVYGMLRPLPNNPGEKPILDGLRGLFQPALEKLSTQYATRAVAKICERCTPEQLARLPRLIQQLDIAQIFAPGRQSVGGVPMDVLSNALRVVASETENRSLDFLEAEMHFRANAEKGKVLFGEADWPGDANQFAVMVSRYIDPGSRDALVIPDDLRANLLEAARTQQFTSEVFGELRNQVTGSLKGLHLATLSVLGVVQERQV